MVSTAHFKLGPSIQGFSEDPHSGEQVNVFGCTYLILLVTGWAGIAYRFDHVLDGGGPVRAH